MISSFLKYLFLSLLLIEVTGNFLGLLGIEPTGYRLIINAEALDEHNGYADRDSIVGVWHRANDKWVQNGPCFTVEMRSNRFGARDNNWDVSKPGNLFLGSSFIEGFGVPYGKRLSEAYELLSGKEVFNCGMAGDFSPVQYYMTIKKFRSTLRFDTCFVFFVLPTDDSLVRTADHKRYRPYLSDTGIAYTRSQAKYPEYKTMAQRISLLFYQYSYCHHLYAFFKSRNYQKSGILQARQPKRNEFKNIKTIVRMFCEDYPDLFFYFVFIPTLHDSPAPPVVFQYSNMKMLDLTGALDKRRNYFVCNSHWNEEGHLALAEALYKEISRR